jgi:hypothetical protein
MVRLNLRADIDPELAYGRIVKWGEKLIGLLSNTLRERSVSFHNVLEVSDKGIDSSPRDFQEPIPVLCLSAFSLERS